LCILCISIIWCSLLGTILDSLSLQTTLVSLVSPHWTPFPIRKAVPLIKTSVPFSLRLFFYFVSFLVLQQYCFLLLLISYAPSFNLYWLGSLSGLAWELNNTVSMDSVKKRLGYIFLELDTFISLEPHVYMCQEEHISWWVLKSWDYQENHYELISICREWKRRSFSYQFVLVTL